MERINNGRKADDTVVNDCSSLCFTSIYQSKHSDLCENCKALKCELQKTHEELKSAQLITDLLVKEIILLKHPQELVQTGMSVNMMPRLAVMKVLEVVLITGFQ
jgi:hypothetical protein